MAGHCLNRIGYYLIIAIMLFEDTYQTLAAASEGQFKDRGSRFIGYAFPVRDETEVKTCLLQIKKEHPSATHHCYAYRFGLDKTAFRVNDDGEPSGSAGRSILNQLLSQQVTNVLVVVVRYYGGTMLGIPGLINAYKTATQAAIDNGKIIQKTINDRYRVQFEYLQLNDVMKIIKEEGCEIRAQDFENTCSMELEIRKTAVNRSLEKLQKVASAKIEYLGTT